MSITRFKSQEELAIEELEAAEVHLEDCLADLEVAQQRANDANVWLKKVLSYFEEVEDA